MLEVKWKVKEQAREMREMRSFNPCYVGSKMERLEERISRSTDVVFQSLLCWK